MIWKNRNWLISERVGGPNNNTFKANNVSIDASGNLVLKITKQNNVWTAAEVALDTSLGFGDYVFTLASPIKYEKNTVAAGFTYLDDSNEIDWEASYWGGATTNLGYTVQPEPYNNINNLEFFIPEGVVGYKVTLHFYPNDISIKTEDALGGLIKLWKYTGTYQPKSNQVFIFNLWLQGDKTLASEQVFSLSDFTFITQGAPLPVPPLPPVPPTPVPPTPDLDKITNDLTAELASQKKLTDIRTEVYSTHSTTIKVNNVKKLL